MDDALERTFRRWLLEEATRNGPEVTPAPGPTAVWHYPFWEVNDCD
jgi:hypothetical protein